LNNYTGTTEILANSRHGKDQPGRWGIEVSSTTESFLMGQSWFRLCEEVKWTTRQAIDVNEAKTINANDAFFSEDLRLAA